MTQSSFEFDVPGPVAPAPAPQPARARRAAPPKALTPEDMARLLEQDANYRVLRRLVPITDYGPAPSAPELLQSAAGTRNVLVLDTETTGLSHQADKIIELAMLLVQVDVASGMPFGPVDCFEGFEDPGMPIPAVAKEVTGISDDMVKGQRLDDQQVAAMVARADLIVAHNAGFDRPFVEARFPYFAQKAWACSFADIDWKAAGAGSSKLSALALDQGWFFDAHRALVDCHALLQVLSRPVGQGTTTGVNQLMLAASRSSFKLRATGAPFEAKDLLKARGYRWDADAKVWCCTLADQARLESELEWLKATVYGRRHARVEVEAMDSLVRYSARAGVASQRVL
ncbi:DNA polymerase-3 subunit epsilon [Hydrogenophaga palleronii]|uniref:DNA polymerase-3 subunit epsilon n=1 Tax=Hydrogenophaga palleronii TaxID=65655 RepID=A0ABU1WQP0_9BURK|nr:3'-5' exonuclease [Hydrogenophaga palleronii]MDR7151623.1 DNA polymerase-3 subunit epsilon [Hydrogenophaga palleronii]